jgi:hypothetical protein
MSNQYIQAALPGLTPARRPLGTLRTVLGDRLARVGHAIWQSLEEVGRRRSNREFLALAEHYQDVNPKLARELRSYARGGSTY